MRLFRFIRRKNRAFAQGNRARDAGQWEIAASHYRKALARRPANSAIWVQLGHALKESGDVCGGEAAYRKALELAPDVADTHLQLGHALKLQGRLGEAASAYMRALAIDPKLHHAALELFNLGWGMSPTGAGSLARLTQDGPQIQPHRCHSRELGAATSIVFDISDLIQYFLRARVPTGMQRVQMNVVASTLRQPRPDLDVTIACFTPTEDYWVVIPQEFFLKVNELAVAGGAIDDPTWQAMLSRLYVILTIGNIVQFHDHEILINLGNSWWLQNYFLMIRSVKRQHRISYVPFVHDCIPLFAPEHCTRALTKDFIGWLIGVFFHADGFLVNSQATSNDLAKAARLLGHSAPKPPIIHLDARLSVTDAQNPSEPEIIGKHRLDRQDFILFVSSIDSRKNHLLAFDAWRSLIDRRGLRNVPMLVCVGNPGWRADAVMAQLNASAPLRRKILILSKLSDAALAELYRRCLFTLYPSCYEGWGLPVTESLCHGKVPLVLRASSLPEAGGELAEYFEEPSVDDLVARLERLIDDHAYRRGREAMIGRQFRPRDWAEIADEVVAGALAQVQPPPALSACAAQAESPPAWPFQVEPGRPYRLSRNRKTSVHQGMIGGEMYRIGSGWWAPSDWGCWLKEAEAEIAFSLGDGVAGTQLLHLGLRGTPANSADYRVSIADRDARESGTLAAGEERWVSLPLEPENRADRTVHLKLWSSGCCPLSDVPNGYRPVATLGVIGFFLCPPEDAAARARLLETMVSMGPAGTEPATGIRQSPCSSEGPAAAPS